MKQTEICSKFNFAKSTVSRWQDQEGRALLLDVLRALPLEYVENIEKQQQEAQNAAALLLDPQNSQK